MDWMSLLLVIFCIYGVIHIIAFFVQDFFFFHPEKLHLGFKFKYPYAFEEVQLEGIDGSLIDCLHFPFKDADKVVFYFKGNTRSIKGWAKFCKDFHANGYSFFIIDYPGFGKSTGKRDVKTIYQNAQIAYDWLKTRYSEDNITIYGRSLGAGFSGYIAMNNNPKVLILDSPFYNFTRLAQYYTRVLFLRYILKHNIPLEKYIKEVKCPIHIIHGEKDKTIPLEQGKDLGNIDKERIKLHIIREGRHNNLPKKEQYHDVLKQILN
jgi:fermentation-respiration switch protein FrsA (DUF1100 family)